MVRGSRLIGTIASLFVLGFTGCREQQYFSIVRAPSSADSDSTQTVSPVLPAVPQRVRAPLPPAPAPVPSPAPIGCDASKLLILQGGSCVCDFNSGYFIDT